MADQNKKTMEMESIEDLERVLDTVSNKVPGLIQNLMNSLYSRENGTRMGQAVGAYYKELVDAGIPSDAVLEMVKKFSFSMKDFNFDNAGVSHGRGEE